MKRYKVVLLLTASINPNGMSRTVLQDSNERKKQYFNALDYYLQNTSYPIVFVENTDTDISGHYTLYIKSHRIEFLCFQGNEYEKSKGKGYGESLIIQYAYYNSKLLASAKYVIKITGRVIVKNINSILLPCIPFNTNIFRCDVFGFGFVRTVVLASSPQCLFLLYCKRMNEITEDKDFLIENIIYEELVKNTNIRLLPFFSTVEIEGIFATKNTPYENKPSKITLRDNLFYWMQIEKERSCRFRANIVKFFYLLSLLR